MRYLSRHLAPQALRSLAIAALAGAFAAASSPALTVLRQHDLERLYSLPSLVGTAPERPTWSRDSGRLAYLWNDAGYPTRDVWVLDVRSGEPAERWTRFAEEMPDLAAGEGDGSVGLAELLARDRAQQEPGVVAIAWHPDGERLVASRGGGLWLIGAPTSGPPRRLATPTPVSQAEFSADGEWLAFLHRGDLWALPVAGLDAGAQAVRVSGLAGDGVAVASFRWAPRGAALALLEEDARRVTQRHLADLLPEDPTLRPVRRAFPGEAAPLHRVAITALAVRDPVAGAEIGVPELGPLQWLDLHHPELEPGDRELGHGDAGAAHLAELRSLGRPGQVLSYDWSADGRHLAVDTSDLYAKDRRVFVADVDSGATRMVWRDADAENESFYFWRIAWSRAAGEEPGGAQRLYLLSDRADDYHVYSLAPDGSEVRRLTAPAAGESWAVSELHPTPHGLHFVANAPNGEQRQLFRVRDGAPTRPERLSERPGTYAPTLSPNGWFAALLHSSDLQPPELWLSTLRFLRDADRVPRERRITHSPHEHFDEYLWVAPRYVSFESHVDGAALHGRLLLPPGFCPEAPGVGDPDAPKLPAILGSVYTDSVRNQWGGRNAHPTWGLDQYLLQQGYVLLNVDVRGSWGRGREFRRGIRLDYGGMDIEDLESGVRYLAGLGYVDMERVGIWGSSYGGLMTAMSLFRKPGLYAAGIAGAPATNVRHALTGQMAVMMEPADQPAAYDDSSPVLHAGGLGDPLMIVHGMRDWVVLYRDSVELVQRLLLAGRDVELVTLPDAGHGWDAEGLAQTRFAFRRMVDFFSRHLEPSPIRGPDTVEAMIAPTSDAASPDPQ